MTDVVPQEIRTMLDERRVGEYSAFASFTTRNVSYFSETGEMIRVAQSRRDERDQRHTSHRERSVEQSIVDSRRCRPASDLVSLSDLGRLYPPDRNTVSVQSKHSVEMQTD